MEVLPVIFSIVALIVIYRIRKQSTTYRGYQTYYLVLAVFSLVLSIVALFVL